MNSKGINQLKNNPTMEAKFAALKTDEKGE